MTKTKHTKVNHMTAKQLRETLQTAIANQGGRHSKYTMDIIKELGARVRYERFPVVIPAQS